MEYVWNNIVCIVIFHVFFLVVDCIFALQAALQHGVIAGRRGFGNIFVVASGNGGQYNDNCNYDGYANSIYTVTIGKTPGPIYILMFFLWTYDLFIFCVCFEGAVDEKGKMPFYAEECASMLAVTFSSGDNKLRSIVSSVNISHKLLYNSRLLEQKEKAGSHWWASLG